MKLWDFLKRRLFKRTPSGGGHVARGKGSTRVRLKKAPYRPEAELAAKLEIQKSKNRKMGEAKLDAIRQAKLSEIQAALESEDAARLAEVLAGVEVTVQLVPVDKDGRPKVKEAIIVDSEFMSAARKASIRPPDILTKEP